MLFDKNMANLARICEEILQGESRRLSLTATKWSSKQYTTENNKSEENRV